MYKFRQRIGVTFRITINNKLLNIIIAMQAYPMLKLIQRVLILTFIREAQLSHPKRVFKKIQWTGEKMHA